VTVPDVTLVPHVDADAEIVMAAADHVEELLPHPEPRRGFTLRERLDPITFEQMKALMRAVV
jgi:hypothetical protein